MNKVFRKITALGMGVVMLMASFLPALKVTAINNPETYTQIRMRGATGVAGEGTTYSFGYNGGNVVVNGGADSAVDSIEWNYGGDQGIGEMQALYTKSTTLTFTAEPAENYVAEARIDGQLVNLVNNSYIMSNLLATEQNPNGYEIEFSFQSNDTTTPVQPSNTNATFDYTHNGMILDFSVNGQMIDVWSQDFDNNNHTSFVDSYNSESGDGTVTFRFETLFINVVNSVTINGETTNFTNTRSEMGQRYANQFVTYEVEVAKADTYVISTIAQEATTDQIPIGNFLWDNDDNSTTAEGDDIIGHGTIEFVSVKYNGVTYTLEDFGEELGPLFDFTNHDTAEDSNGGMVLPVGAEVTLRLTPEAGYQLTNFGINGGEFEPQENVGEYTFEILPGNGHLAATFTAVEDEVNTESEAIAEGTIEFGGNEDSMSVGTARLDVTDATALTDEEKANFADQVESYEMKTFLNISLYNTVQKAQTGDSWDTEVEELDHAATITLTLEEGVNGEDIVIVHRKDDGTFEIIETTYDPATNTISFKTNSFSPYAIATRSAIATPETGKSTRDGSFAVVAIKTISGICSVVVAIAMAIFVDKRLRA